MSAPTQYRRAFLSDMDAVLALLESVRLPTFDLRDIGELRMWVAESETHVCGVIALEPFGSEGLLRSLAVSTDYRNRGIGRTLVAHLEAGAREDGITRLVLLTESAQAFFRTLEYQPIDRGQVGDWMKRCAQFQSLCPASASCMAKAL